MDFHELDAFCTLARTLHFGKAAAILNASPSSISRLLDRLETEAAVTLIQRDSRSVILTDEGRRFLDFAQDCLRRKDELHLVFNSNDGELHGTLRVFASVTACYSILPPLVAALRFRHPGLRLSVDTGDPADAESAIRQGKADIALAALPPGGFHDLDAFSVQRTPLVFATRKNGPFGATVVKAKPSDLHQLLSTCPLIVPQKGLSRERFDRWIKAQAIQPNISAETSGNEAVLALAHLGLGLGLVPRIVLENSPFLEGLVLFDAGNDFGDYDIGFILSVAKPGKILMAIRSVLEEINHKQF